MRLFKPKASKVPSSYPGASTEEQMPATPDVCNGSDEIPSSQARTGQNALKFVLQALSIASQSIPAPGLKPAADVLLMTISNIQRTSDNAKAFNELAERIQPIVPFIQQMPMDEGATTRTCIRLLQDVGRQLGTLAEEIQVATAKNKIHQFFNSADNSAAIRRHLVTLEHIVSELTLITSSNTYQEATKANAGIRTIYGEIQTLRTAVLTQGASSTNGPARAVNRYENIIGGDGQIGGSGDEGGDGGDGGQINIKLAAQQSYHFKDIRSGSGGRGGDGKAKGGRGGNGGDIVIG